MDGRIFTVILAVASLMCACADDGSSESRSAQSRVDGAISATDDSVRAYYEQVCSCYYDALEYTSQSECVQDSYDPLDVSSCERNAAKCDLDSFERFYACQASAFEIYRGCMQSCPTEQDALEQCTAEFESASNACNGEITQALAEAYNACESGMTPNCGGSDPGNSSNNNTGGGCVDRQEFVNLVSNRPWSSTYYAGSGGVKDCEDDAACIREQYVIAGDGSFTLLYMNDPDFGDINDYAQQICVYGTWTLSCNQITFTDCRGSDTYGLELTGNGFKLDARVFEEAGFFADPGEGLNCTSRPCGWD